MSFAVVGLLCLGMMAVLFVGMIAGVGFLLATNKDPRFWSGLARVGMIGGPVLGGALLLMLLGGVTVTKARRVESQQTSIHYSHDLEERMTAEPVRTPDADQHRLVSEPELTVWQAEPVNDLRPVESSTPGGSVVSIIPATPALPATPHPSGDLRSVTRPDWLKIGTTKEGYITTTVLSSSLFATEQEAEEDAKQRFVGLIRADVVQFGQQRGFALFGTLPVEREQLLPLYLRDRFVEVETRDLGTVTAPMYRVWMKLEQSPQTQTQLAAHYRRHVADFRMVFVGLIAASFLAIPLAILGTSSGIRATHGHGRIVWKSAGVLAVLAVWMVGLYLLRTGALMFH